MNATSNDSSKPLPFFVELKELVAVEASAQRREWEVALNRTVDARVARGRCVTGLCWEHESNPLLVRYRCSRNDSEFREGDRVVLHTGTPFEPVGKAIWVRDGIRRDGSEYVEFGVDAGTRKRLEQIAVPLTVDPDFFDLSGILEKGLDEMGATTRGRERILPLLLETAESDSFNSHDFSEAFADAEASGFNESQQDAVAMGASADWCTLIQGPPGTGKTRVLAQVVRGRIAKGERILVTACTHRAIHEALNKCRDLNPDFSAIAKIGEPTGDRTLRVPEVAQFHETPFAKDTGPYVVGATPFGARSQRLAGAEFDCVIIDEASQMTLPLAVLAMLSADVYVIIGDERQLPPVMVSQSGSDATSYGLFQRLSGTCPKERLNTTYRMNEAIGTWVSDTFYCGELRSHEGARDRRLSLSGEPSQQWLAEVVDPAKSLVWIRTHAANTRHYSMEEADLVHQILVELHRRGHPLRDIGILTPFRRQARTLRRRLLVETVWDPADLEPLVIDTVERMQGQEREVILVSTAAADAGFLGAIQEFIYLPARLNVMVSRARVKVIVLASDGFLRPEGLQEGPAKEAIALWESLREASAVVEI